MERELKIGDQLYCEGRWGSQMQLARVAKITATQITLDSGERLVKRSLRVVGSTGYGAYYWHPVTDKNRERVQNHYRRGVCMSVISTAKWGELSVEKLKQIVDIIKPKEPK